MNDDIDLARLERAVRKLRDIDRQVFLAHRLDDLTYETIAQCTGLTVVQVEEALSRALCTIDRELSRPPRRWRFWPF